MTDEQINQAAIAILQRLHIDASKYAITVDRNGDAHASAQNGSQIYMRFELSGDSARCVEIEISGVFN
jgi:hypothetical protein